MRRFRRFSEATPAPEKKSPYKEKKHKLMNPKAVDSIVKPITSSVSDRYRRKGGGPALITNEYTPMTVMKQKSVTLNTLKPCKPSARAGTSRECQVELTFLDTRAAAAVSKHNGGVRVDPGPYMRVCLRPKQPGRLIRINDPIEAKKFSEDWCRCTKREGDGEKCLRVNQTLERAPFGRSRRKATRRR